MLNKLCLNKIHVTPGRVKSLPVIGKNTADDAPWINVPNPRELSNFSGPMTSRRMTAYKEWYCPQANPGKQKYEDA